MINDTSTKKLIDFDKHMLKEIKALGDGKDCKCGRCEAKVRTVISLMEQLRHTLLEPLHDRDTYECLERTLAVAAIMDDYVGRYLSEPFWARYAEGNLLTPKKGLSEEDQYAAYAELCLMANFYQDKSDKMGRVADAFVPRASLDGPRSLADIARQIRSALEKEAGLKRPRKKKKPD